MIGRFHVLFKKISTFCLAFSLIVCFMYADDVDVVNAIKTEIDKVQKHVHLFTTHYGIVKSEDAGAMKRLVVSKLQGNTKLITTMIIDAAGILDVVGRHMKGFLTRLSSLSAEQQSKVFKLLMPLRDSIDLIEVIIEPTNLGQGVILDAALVQKALERFIERQKTETVDTRNYVHVIALKDIYTAHALEKEVDLRWVHEAIYYQYPSKSGNLTGILNDNWGAWPFDLYTLAALEQWKEQYVQNTDVTSQNPVFEAERIMLSKIGESSKTKKFRALQYQRLGNIVNVELEKLALPTSKSILFQRAFQALKIARQYLYRRQEKLDLLHTKLEEFLDVCLKKNDFQPLPGYYTGIEEELHSSGV